MTVRGVRREVKPTGMTRDEESREVEPTSLSLLTFTSRLTIVTSGKSEESDK